MACGVSRRRRVGVKVRVRVRLRVRAELGLRRVEAVDGAAEAVESASRHDVGRPALVEPRLRELHAILARDRPGDRRGGAL